MTIKRSPAKRKKVGNSKPKLWSEEKTRKAMEKAIVGTYGIGADIAYNLGVSTETLYNWQKKYPWIKEMRAEAREVIIDKAESKLYKKIEEEEDWAIKFALTTLGRYRGFVNETKVEHTGEIKHLNITFEQPKEFIEATVITDELEDKTDK